jgi:hypothetical protein
MTSGWGIQPQITCSPPDRPQMKNNSQREHTSPAPKKKNTTTKHDGRTTRNIYTISQYPTLPTTTGEHTTLSYSRNFYSISTYLTDHMTLGSSIHPQITHSPPSPPHTKNDTQTQHPSPKTKKKYISTTNHDGHTKHTLWTPLNMYSHGRFLGIHLSRVDATNYSNCLPITQIV